MELRLVYNEGGAEVYADAEFGGDLGEALGKVFQGDALVYVKRLLEGGLLVDFAQGIEAAVGEIKIIVEMRQKFFKACGLLYDEGSCSKRESLKASLNANENVVIALTESVLNQVLATVRPYNENENLWGFDSTALVPAITSWFALQVLNKLYGLMGKVRSRSEGITLDGDESQKGYQSVFTKVAEIVRTLHAVRLGNLIYPIVEKHFSERGEESGNPFLIYDLGAGSGVVFSVVLNRLIDHSDANNVQVKDYDKAPKATAEWGSILEGYGLGTKMSMGPRAPEGMDVLSRNFDYEGTEKSVDVINVSNLLHKLPKNEHRRFMENVYRLLKPGGIVIINTPWHQENGSDLPKGMKEIYEECDTTEFKDAILSEEGVVGLMESCGFEIEEGDVYKTGFDDAGLDGFAHIKIVGRKPLG
ncbi:class I SAM-dependent methyltransferase [Candidatus Gracilibacteria bacterium]|nr:class I SAM-dependent methyltransferase [Candidatus Gracilibacteria bacterium]